jgi:hypothetical protein
MIRGELEDASGSGWDLRRVQQTVLKAGARVAEHGRRIFVDVAKAAGVLWGRLLERVRRVLEAAGRRELRMGLLDELQVFDQPVVQAGHRGC